MKKLVIFKPSRRSPIVVICLIMLLAFTNKVTNPMASMDVKLTTMGQMRLVLSI
jgi:hypothetical protein